MTFDDNMLPTINDPAVSLVRGERGLALVGEGMELRCDLAGMLPRIKPGRLSRELLVRAARIKGVEQPRAIDATAGFGEDALLLAAAGFHVQLFEHDPVIAALLADGLADMPGGFVIMVAAITAAGVLVSVGNRLEASFRRQSRKRPRAGNASDLSHSTIYSSYLQAK